MAFLETRHDGAVVTLTIDRPDKLNALNAELLRELAEAAVALESDPSVRVAIVTGTGDRAFAAGADIEAMSEMTPLQARRFADLGHALGAALEQSRIPYLAAVNGYALGAGCELAMCCDVIYATERAKLGQPEVNLGVIPGFGGTQRLSRRIGAGRARELCMTGRTVSAEEAYRLGLVDAVVPHEQLLSHVQAIAGAIAAKPPLAIAAIKRTIFRGQDVSLATATEFEAASFAILFSTEDQREGMRAFLEKRAPRFEGR